MSLPLPLPIEDLYIKSLTIQTCTGCGAGGAIIGVPAQGGWGIFTGGVFQNVAEIDSTTMSVATAMDQVEILLEKILPTPPPTLNTLTLSMVDTLYSAYQQGSATLRSNVENNSSRKPQTNIIGWFGNADTGTLSAIVKDSGAAASVQGTITLTTSDETGDYDQYIYVDNDGDPYFGIPGQEGIYKALKAHIGNTPAVSPLTASSTVQYSYQMRNINGISYLTNTILFYQDDAFSLTPSVNVSGAGNGIYGVNYTSGSYVSGVPRLATSDGIKVKYICSNVVGMFYNSTHVGRVQNASYITALDSLPTGADRNTGATPTFDVVVNPIADVYTASLSVTCLAYNSAGTSASATAVNNSGLTIQLDTNSLRASGGGFLNEGDRKDAGVGQFPVYANTAYDPTISLALNEEMQLIDGVYQFPPAVSYVSNLPSGPNYSALPAGSYNGYRWLEFNLGPATLGVEAVTITLENPTGSWGPDPIQTSNFQLYIMVPGSTGWLDCNAAYPGVNIPVANGAPCLDLANTFSPFVRRCTFGPTAYNITVLAIRIGFNATGRGITGVSWIGS